MGFASANCQNFLHQFSCSSNSAKVFSRQSFVLCGICFLPWLVWRQLGHLSLASTAQCVIKATPIQFMDGNKLKSCRMGLTNHIWPISHYIMPLVTHTITRIKMISSLKGLNKAFRFISKFLQTIQMAIKTFPHLLKTKSSR